jgi:tetratricopeptide (TPR) repeat protein
MKFGTSKPLTLISSGILLIIWMPSSLLSAPQQPGEGETGGLARTDGALLSLRAEDARQRLAHKPGQTPRREAVDAYNRGLDDLQKALRLDEKAAAAAGDRSARRAARAQKSYAEAIGKFRAALEQEPDLYQALGGLGYALLRTGQYEEALEAYDRAFEIGPVYPEAIEERAEACLGLDRLAEAKDAWTELREVDRELAAELMSAMKRWVDLRRADPAGLTDESIESFAEWVEGRAAQR